jgi:hypothetical protein
MKSYKRILLATAVGLMASTLGAQPSTQPALPAGHPPLPAGHPEIPAATRPALPAGHPEIPARPQPQLPSGHPEIPGAGNEPQLPAGHPDFGQGKKANATEGVLAIRVKQGSKAGPAIKKDTPVTVELLHRGQPIRKTEVKLNERGVAILQKLPLLLPFQPVASIEYGGTTFRGYGPLMDGQNPAQQVELTVYETTDKAPDISVQSRHLMLDPQPDGNVKVTDVLAIENPGDKAWVGAPAADGRQLVFSVNIPAGVSTMDVRAFEGGELRLDPGKLTIAGPLIPGVSHLQFSYVLPAKDGKVQLAATAPVPVKHMMVVLPDNGSQLEAKGLEPGGTADTGQGKSILFKGVDLRAGHETVLIVTPPKRADAGNSKTPQVVAAVGGTLVLAIGTGYILLKKPRSSAPAVIAKAS